MRFSKEFTEWWISLLSKYELKREEVFGDKKNEWDMKSDLIYIPVQWVYDAFNAHNEELKQLREFKKKFQKLQNKLQQLDKKYYDDIQAEFKFNDVVEEIMYL